MSSPPLLVPVKPAFSVSTISRPETTHSRQRSGDIRARPHSLNPALHPFAQAREYTRALNAVKYEKLFSKPFLFALDGHRDGVYCINRVRKNLTHAVSGGCDGELRLWQLSTRTTAWAAAAHAGFVRSAVSDASGEHIYTCSSDMTVKCWDVDQDKRQRMLDSSASSASASASAPSVTPTATFLHPHAIQCMDHHQSDPLFAAASSIISLYHPERPDPIHSFSWGAESINSVAFSPVEQNLLLSSSSDRSVVLYDVRQRSPLKKLVLLMQTNAIALSPLDAFFFTTASEDHNLYTFDVRALDHALTIHKDHVSAVISVDYAPTGKEFVSGAYDRTVRLWDSHSASGGVGGAGGSGGRSKEVYHTKRMQRVFGVRYTWDAQYVLSASDDSNVRVWKARASAKLGVMGAREQEARDYRDRLVERFGAVEEVRRIHQHRHVPKAVLNAKKLKAQMEAAEKRKEKERRKHKRPAPEGQSDFVSVKKKTVRTEVE